MRQKTRYQCRDCKAEYDDYTGDKCPECGGADVILLGDSHPDLELEFTVDSADWTEYLTESIIEYIEDDRGLRPPKEPRINVSVNVVREDSREST